MLRALLQGQLISLLIAGTGVFASVLSDLHANFPMLLSFLNYILLSLFIWRKTIVQKVNGFHGVHDDKAETSDLSAGYHDNETSTAPIEASDMRVPVDCTPKISRQLLGYYLGAAIIDVEANFLIIQAYNYTSITSIMLLDCFTIPCAMGLSYLFLGCRYNYYHLWGVVFCILGLICIVISDLMSEETEYGTSPIFGDLLCLLGSGLYAASNVTQEYLVKYHDRDEYLGFVGSCGALISGVQLLSLNFVQLRRTKFTSTVLLSISGFVSCLFLMYINTSAFLQYGDSTLFNLSLLTSDIYAVLFSYFFYGYLVPWLYFVAFALVATGLLIYHSAEEPSRRRDVPVYAARNENTSRNDRNYRIQGSNGVILNPDENLDFDRTMHIVTVLPSSLSSVSLTKTLFDSVQNNHGKSAISTDLPVPSDWHSAGGENRTYREKRRSDHEVKYCTYEPLRGEDNPIGNERPEATVDDCYSSGLA
jgi:solute carrier family 35, member F1/2